MEEFSKQEKISRQQKKDLIKELKNTKLSAKSSSLTRTRTQPSNLDTSYFSCDEFRASDTPSPPPYPLAQETTPPDSAMTEILSSGHYYSFDKDNTYEPVMTAGKDKNHGGHDGLETSAELLNIERSLYELSQRQQQSVDGGSASVRNSFLSVDSGNYSKGLQIGTVIFDKNHTRLGTADQNQLGSDKC